MDGVKHGVSVTMTGFAETVLTEDELQDQFPWAQVVTGAGIVSTSSSLAPLKTPEFRGKLLPNSFFVLTQQLQEHDRVEEESLQHLLDVISDGAGSVKSVDMRVLQRRHGTDAVVQD
jgi:hypothetical protein